MTEAPSLSNLLADFARQQDRDPVSPAVAAWALWFDVLREHVEAAADRHPLRAA